MTAYKTESDGNSAETNVMAGTVLLFLSEIVCIARTGLLSKEHIIKKKKCYSYLGNEFFCIFSCLAVLLFFWFNLFVL